jgi:SAM-dependent methyltransferase
MNWRYLRPFPWLDTRARFVAGTPRGGTLLDLGSSDGETLGHIAELRPDLRLLAADVNGQPERYPSGCQFARVDLEKQPLPWPDGSVDAITCMHVVEHLRESGLVFREVVRLLRPGGRVYFETPHPKTLSLPSLRGQSPEARTRTDCGCDFTLNFHDDPTHVRVVPVDELATGLRGAGLEVCGKGISRNWLFVAAHPVFHFLPPSRKKYTAQVHWLGWSAWLAARRPAEGLRS